MNETLNERIVIAYERIALALEGLRDEAKKAGAIYWPLPKEQREAVLTRVETDQERELRMQGARRRTIEEVVDPNVEEPEEEYIGPRTRQWMKDNPNERKVPTPSGEELI
jgi:hypothetical protein